MPRLGQAWNGRERIKSTQADSTRVDRVREERPGHMELGDERTCLKLLAAWSERTLGLFETPGSLERAHPRAV